MWGVIQHKTYKLNEHQYLAWVKPKFPNLHNTLEKFTDSCGLEHINNILYKKAIWCYEINDLVVATSLTEPRLSKFDKEGWYPVIMEKVQYSRTYEESLEVWQYWFLNHHKENHSYSKEVLNQLYIHYAQKIKSLLNISYDKFFKLVYNKQLSNYNFVLNPIDETINPFEFIVKSFN